MSSCMTDFNYYCNQTERILTEWAAIPAIGVLPAVCKFTLGTIQTISALALGILSAPLRCCSDDAAAFNDHCWSHVVHGLGNIAASLVEAIPFVGTYLFINRRIGMHIGNPEQQDKYIPYSDLIARDMQAIGGVAERYVYDTTAPSAISPTRFRAFIGINVVSTPRLV